ncbi:MAG: epoxyqueuosine reductase QueH [Candidatus Omnitrophica bacterium]|nr:epoxyqueuosine reductase QueH [Candidatus Omnitrophota bacterium]
MKEKIVVHICCGVCAIKTIEFLQRDFEVLGYWYNPNIHPYSEYKARLQTAGYVFQRIGKEIEWDFDYDITGWFNMTLPFAKDREKRCRSCYQMRLEKTAQFAKSRDIKLFTTTMFYSIHQDIEAIKEIGNRIAQRHSIEFLPLDLRQYYNEGKKITKDWLLYRQKYCGCLFSEIERERTHENLQNR